MRDSLPSFSPRSDSDARALRQRYRNFQLLGKGGLAEVFKVDDTTRGMVVALKRLRRDIEGNLERTRRMFEAEYHTLKQLQHPSIIEVYDYGVDHEFGPYYTMELLSGRDLRELAPLPWREACRVLMDVASSLAVVHSRRLVHRDVTPRNVLCTADGRAKLLDFGALTEMGVARDFAGTPAYAAPEAVLQQALDGRADLYSLGAVAYYLLTRQHAFPRNDLQTISEYWRMRPLSLCKHDPSIPRALDTLVMALLQIDPLARPESAAEVMTRLSALADLPSVEDPAVAHAYLTVPKLIAREEIIGRIRTQLSRAKRRRGGTLLFEAASGLGRSRLLDSCALEGQLSGALVVRADATDATSSLGVARRLLQRLLERKPALADRVAELQLDPTQKPEQPLVLERREAIARMSLLFSQAAERSNVLVIVDDIHACDEPSVALLASLTAEARSRHLSLALSLESGASTEESNALRVIGEFAYRMQLKPLTTEETRALLASVFGEIPALDLLTGLMTESCDGVPRAIMAGAQALLDAKLATYEAGNWSLSDDASKLAECLARAGDLQTRLSALSADALELLQLLALDRDHRLDDADYEALCQHRDPARVRDALRELVQRRLLARSADTHHFVHGSDQRGLSELLSADERASIHLRIAERLEEKCGDGVYELYHFVCAGKASLAHAAMRRYLAMADANPRRLRASFELETVARLVEVGTNEAWPLPVLTLYRSQLTLLAAAFGAWEVILPQADALLQALSDYCGLTDYHALHELPPAQRMPAALGAAKQRFEAVPADTHPLPPLVAIRSLTRACTLVAASAYWMVEPSGFAKIPSLLPLVPLSPALGLTERIVQAFRALTEGREWIGWDAFKQLYLDVSAMPETQLDARSRYTLVLVVLSPVCFRDARHGASTALSHCAALAPTQPDQASNYAMLYHMAVGDAVEATRAREQAEILSLRAGATNDTRLTRLQTSAFLYPYADDLMGLKRTLEGLHQVCGKRPGWRFTRDLCHAHLLRCRGKLTEALAMLEQSLKDLPEAHYDFGPSAEAHVLLLTQLGRLEEADRLGARYLERARARDIPTAWLALAVARCLAERARHAEAEALWHAALIAFSERDIGGVHLGYAYEVGARLAQKRDDHAAFEALREQCGRYYLPGRYPPLTAKYKSLRDTTEDAELEAAPGLGVIGPIQMQTALSQCRDRMHRGGQVLEWLYAQVGGDHGFLFGIRGGFLELLSDGSTMPSDMLDAVQAYLGRELDDERDVTLTEMFGGAPQPTVDTSTLSGYVPVLLRASDDLGEFVVGVAVVLLERSKFRPPPPRFLLNLCHALLATGDVERARIRA